MTNTLCVDIDGPLAQFEQAATDKFGLGLGRHLYSLEARFPDRADEVRAWANDPKTYETLDLTSGVRFGLTAIVKLCPHLEILAVSARPADSYDITYQWLNRHHLLAFLGGLTIVNWQAKPETIRALDPIAAIEDSPAQAQALAAKGIPVILFDCIYNLDFWRGDSLPPGHARAMGWFDIASIVPVWLREREAR
jgi:uncharacterized HAD superfamily protein